MNKQASKWYVPLPSCLSREMSSQEMYGDIAVLASIPSKSQKLLCPLMVQRILAVHGSRFAVHANFAEIVTDWVSSIPILTA